jgi:hypothetical protein
MAEKIMSLFLDTSVIGGYYDDVFMQDTRLLFQNINDGKYIAFVSSYIIKELEPAPEKVRNILKELDCKLIQVIPEYEALADEYIKENVVGETNREDCVHIATATINNIDILVSWNFKHIVNVQRIKGYNSVNIKNGYKPLDIRNPKEVIFYE